MSERKYTVAEIDALRAAVRSRFYGAMPDNYFCDIKAEQAAIEDRLRTHMLAGHTADDFKAQSGGKG